MTYLAANSDIFNPEYSTISDGDIFKAFQRLEIEEYMPDGGKCFETEDGTQMDLREVMEYLAKKEEEGKDE